MISPDLAIVNTTTKVANLDTSSGTAATYPNQQQSQQYERETKVDGMPCVRQYYQKQGFFEHVTDILMKSWRSNTRKQHQVYLKKWHLFCSTKKITPHCPNIGQVLEFLYSLIDLSYYSTLNNTARSALSTFISIVNVPVGHCVPFSEGCVSKKTAN